ncbi:UvrD-helicase domain-containing protein [Ensifer adhaerens]|uniref:UvrD-helicase domain-containing protein n=1 Tax=Ensifer adhaerens TaxID=106592 RepID=UPI001C4DE68A|nr:UvrD-helicase domain-containing protein [Ensifer adhaerens]MBW0365850.1 UvrD-helicase domain-containing protein [Ensifer adhaerens]UCM20245.1 UvrD-helicase domain-containing protein [Ensifer adhaerens]
MSDRLTLVPAGAGSGKTYRIETTLADLVVNGDISADRILAVTFTEAAASDLRTRIRGALLDRGRINEALAIDRAYVGTIHALGLRLLTEHAFAAARSPASRLLSDSERDLLIRLQVGRGAALAPILNALPRYGYEWNRNTLETGEEQLRKKVMNTIDLLRSLGQRGFATEIIDQAVGKLRTNYGPTKDAARLEKALSRAVGALLTSFPESIANTVNAKTAKEAFDKDFDTLRHASLADSLTHDWSLWQRLRGLRLSNSRTKTPEGYDRLASAVIAAADELRHHPGPLKDAEIHFTALVHGAQEIMAAYEAEKRSRGLMDYADMIVETEALLCARPDILNAVLGEIDCVVIDEFQDTNPVQFAMLWRLAALAPRALIVGDRKQAIMGFQGADPRLSEALDAAHASCVEPLTQNWRSDPRIMSLVNAIGPALFPEGYDPLSPTRRKTGQTAIELIEFEGKKGKVFEGIAAHARELLDGETLVADRETEGLRPIRPADIAVLVYTHLDAAEVGKALRDFGLPVRLPEDGWFLSQVVQVVRAALAVAADPTDRFASLLLLSLGPSRMPLDLSLPAAIDNKLLQIDCVRRLADFADNARNLTVSAALPHILEIAGIEDWIATLPERAAAEADLGRLFAEATSFDRAAAGLREAAGFHGNSIQSFLGWLADQAERGLDYRPDREGWEVEGIEVSTWHASKGREWPVTIVGGMDFVIPARGNMMRAEFASFEKLDAVLEGAGLSWFPAFDCPEAQAAFAEKRIAEDEREAARALYVALTRARDRLILALPSKQGNADERAKTMADLLRRRTGLSFDAGTLTVCGVKLPAICRIIPKDTEYNYPELPQPSGVHQIWGRRAPLPTAERTTWRISPSSLAAQNGTSISALTHIDLGAPAGRQVFKSATDRGTAYHLAFRTLAERPDLAVRLPAATGLSNETITAIDKQVHALRAWLESLGFNRLSFEVPLQVRADDGSENNAIIDLLAESRDALVIVDHKTGPCPDPEARFGNYLPQLEAYARMLAAKYPGKPVRFLAINWMDEGQISFVSTANLITEKAA